MSIVPHPNITFRINDVLIFNCSLNSSVIANDYTIGWYLNDIAIQPGNTNLMVVNNSNNKSSLLQFVGIIDYSQDVVTCAVAIGSNTVSNTSTLLILQKGQRNTLY